MSDNLDALIRLRAQQLQIERDIEREVWTLRGLPTRPSWSQIGDALGITKQAAHQRLGRLDDLELDEFYDALTTDQP